MPSLRCTSCGMRFRRGTAETTMLEHLLSCSAGNHQNAKTRSNSVDYDGGSISRDSREEEDDDSSSNSSALDRKPPAKRASELSEDTTSVSGGGAAAAGLLALKSFPSNGSISGSSSPVLPRRRAATGASASNAAASAKKVESEDEEGIQDDRLTHDLRHTSVDSLRYECPCCQHEFFTTQTSWEEIQLHVTSCVDLNESIDSAKLMASALVTMKSSPEIPEDIRASRKRKLAPKAAAAAAAAAEAASADTKAEGKKRAPKRNTTTSKTVKSSKTYSARKKKPPRPSKRRDRTGSVAAAASEKRKRAQDIASLSSGSMQQTLKDMVMGHLDLFYN